MTNILDVPGTPRTKDKAAKGSCARRRAFARGSAGGLRFPYPMPLRPRHLRSREAALVVQEGRPLQRLPFRRGLGLARRGGLDRSRNARYSRFPAGLAGSHRVLFLPDAIAAGTPEPPWPSAHAEQFCVRGTHHPHGQNALGSGAECKPTSPRGLTGCLGSPALSPY